MSNFPLVTNSFDEIQKIPLNNYGIIKQNSLEEKENASLKNSIIGKKQKMKFYSEVFYKEEKNDFIKDNFNNLDEGDKKINNNLNDDFYLGDMLKKRELNLEHKENFEEKNPLDESIIIKDYLDNEKFEANETQKKNFNPRSLVDFNYKNKTPKTIYNVLNKRKKEL